MSYAGGYCEYRIRYREDKLVTVANLLPAKVEHRTANEDCEFDARWKLVAMFESQKEAWEYVGSKIGWHK